MRPPSNREFEKVKVGEFLNGVIKEVQYEKEHEFQYLGTVTKTLGIRFQLELEGYEHLKYTRWMKFNLGARANLYKKFVSTLVAGATPNIDFDLDELQGLKIQTYWVENEKGYQNIELIKPVGNKINVKQAEDEKVEAVTAPELVETAPTPTVEATDPVEPVSSAPDDDLDFESLP